MGVKGLWRLLMPIGRRISIETLAGKILAIDASIWMNQFLKAMRDPDTGNVRPAAHLIGFIRRLCKLRFQGIRPVLVFDGATPEIKQRELRERQKRREQLSAHGQDQTIDSVQRMAKRLLVQQLKKNGTMGVVGALKNSNKASSSLNESATTAAATMANTGTVGVATSVAPGFYNPEMEVAEQVDKKPKDGPYSKHHYEKLEGDRRPVAPRKNTHTGMLATAAKEKTRSFSGGRGKLITTEEEQKADVELIEILQNDDYLQQSTCQSNDQNDWDTAIVETGNVTDALSSTASCVESEGQPQQTNFAPPNRLCDPDGAKSSKKIWTKSQVKNRGTKRRARKITTGEQEADIRNYTSLDKDFDIEYVASLLPTERKDLVEGAQRNRRLQSRREFMKVAYDPEGLSKCQLRNFLKSSRLNQEIHQMARKVALAQEEESQWPVGSKAVALHRTKKIIFETNEGDKIDKRLKRPTTKNDIIFRTTDEASIISSGRKHQSVIASSSEDNSDNDIQWDNGNEVVHKLSVSKKGAFDLVDKRRAIVDAESTDSENESNDGGFIATTASKSKCERMKKDGIASMERDEKLVQEMEDENLARALQAAEDEDSSTEGGGFTPCFSTREDRSPHATQAVGVEMIEMLDHENVHEEAKPKIIRIRKSGNSDGETYRQTTNKMIEDETPTSALQHSFYNQAVARLEESPNEPLLRNGHSQEGSITTVYERVVPDINRCNSEVDTEDEVDWEDGDEVGWEDGDEGDKHTVYSDLNVVRLEKDHTKEALKLKASHETTQIQEHQTVAPSTKNLDGDELLHVADLGNVAFKTRSSNNDFTANHASFKGVHSEDIEKNVSDVSLFTSDEKNVAAKLLEGDNPFEDDFQIVSPSKNNEMVAALEHAQATAANLTNWAGRAFRRAVAQHAEESGFHVPESAKPRVLEHPNRPGFVTSESFAETKGSKRASGQRKKGVDNELGIRLIDAASSEKKGRNVSTWPESLPTEDVQQTLQAYQEQWAKERNQEDRDMETVTDEMRADVIQLLQLFGVPYVESPAEAEAQCVELERLGLVDGIVTEDSDALVFGGQRIYKNIFDGQKYVEVYDAKDAESEMNLTHDGLVALAMLLGGDYTEGVKGVGIVNGMEIIDAFDVSSDLKTGLNAFRQWLDGFDPSDVLRTGNWKKAMTKEQIFHLKHHNARTRWIAPKYFPDPKVLTAYLKPVVDTSEVRFSWGFPDMERLILFCNKHVGWSPEETRHLLQPVTDAIKSKASTYQTRIDSFMRYEQGIKFADVRSKRLRDVLKNAPKFNADRDEPLKKKSKSESKYFNTSI